MSTPAAPVVARGAAAAQPDSKIQLSDLQNFLQGFSPLSGASSQQQPAQQSGNYYHLHSYVRLFQWLKLQWIYRRL